VPAVTANTVKTMSDEEGAWVGKEMTSRDWFKDVIEEDYTDMPELEEVSDSDDEVGEDRDRFEEVDVKEGDESCESATDKSVIETEDEIVPEEFGDTSGEAFVVAESVQTAGSAKLYDSGCTNHISPYQNQFKNYELIEPQHFRAANKQTFSTTRKEELIIDLPIGDGGITQLCLLNVLYSAEVGYTLVSVGKLNDAGFTATFGGGKCTIKRHDRDVEEVVGVVQKTLTGVYKMEHEDSMANAAEERLMLESFH